MPWNGASSGRRVVAMVGVGVLAATGVGLLARTRPSSTGASSVPASATSFTSARAQATPFDAGELAVVPSSLPSSPSGRHTVVADLAWGSGHGQIGHPNLDEGRGETPLRLATGRGEVLLLDGENGRLVRVGRDGGVDRDIALPVKAPKDVAVTDDGTLLLLASEEEEGKVTLVGRDGKVRGALPVPRDLAPVSRSVVVAGADVFVEALDGELRRVGSTDGTFDGDAGVAPGLPMKDGRGYVSARIIEDDPGAVHVYVVERGSLAQRFSRLLRARLVVEGIFLVDSNAEGTIYLGVLGPRQGGDPEAMTAELLCLDGRHGQIVGAVELGVRLGPEAIVDAKALEAGGVVLSVSTARGVRVERVDCT